MKIKKTGGIVFIAIAILIVGGVVTYNVLRARALTANYRARNNAELAQLCAQAKETQVQLEETLERGGTYLDTRQRIEIRDNLARLVAFRRNCPAVPSSGRAYSGEEADLEEKLSFECAQQWRQVKTKGYGFSDKCRAEYEAAQKPQ